MATPPPVSWMAVALACRTESLCRSASVRGLAVVGRAAGVCGSCVDMASSGTSGLPEGGADVGVSCSEGPPSPPRLLLPPPLLATEDALLSLLLTLEGLFLAPVLAGFLEFIFLAIRGRQDVDSSFVGKVVATEGCRLANYPKTREAEGGGGAIMLSRCGVVALLLPSFLLYLDHHIFCLVVSSSNDGVLHNRDERTRIGKKLIFDKNVKPRPRPQDVLVVLCD